MKRRLVFFYLLITAILVVGCSGAYRKEVLNIFNWSGYIDEELLEIFEEETGIEVNYQTFSTNEDMYLKVKSGDSIYDVLIPSDYMIERMVIEGLLQPLDYRKITNYHFISPIFQNLVYDNENKYSVPYFWGTLGILYNTELVDDVVDSWDILWNEKYSKQIFMMYSQRDSLAVALKKLGFSINSIDENELELAKQELIKQKPLVLDYIIDDIDYRMLSEEGALALAWSGDALDTILKGKSFDYVVPKEGSNFWVDAMVIPADAQNVEAAHKFIDFMTRPEIAARNSEYIGYSTPNEAALEFIPDDMINNLVAYPDQTVIDNCEIFRDPGEYISLYNMIWNEVINYQ